MTDESTSSDIGFSLRSILHGASVFVVGRMISKGLGFFINLMLTRGLGARLFGVYGYTTTLMSIFAIFAQLGTGESMLRFLPEYEDDRKRRNLVLGLASVTTIGASILTAAFLYVLAPVITAFTIENSLLTTTLRVLAIVLPFNTISNLITSVFRSIEFPEYRVVIEDIAEPLVRIVFIGIALLLGYSLTGVVSAIAAGGVVVFLFATVILFIQTDFRPSVAIDDPDQEGLAKRFYNFSIPISFKNMGSFLYNRVDILMIGIFLTDTSIGLYKIAIVVSTLLVIPIRSFKELFPSVAARLYSNDKMEKLDSVYKIMTRWMLTITLFPALVLIVYRSNILRVFGGSFIIGSEILLIFTLGQIVNSAAGPSGVVLMMTGHQYVNLANQWVFGILNIILNFVLINELGLIGAAVATGLVLIGINIIRVIEVWYFDRLFPYRISFWKPIIASVVTLVVMEGLRKFFDGYMLLLVGGSTGFIVFFLLLWKAGIEAEDREIIEKMWQKWQTDSA